MYTSAVENTYLKSVFYHKLIIINNSGKEDETTK